MSAPGEGGEGISRPQTFVSVSWDLGPETLDDGVQHGTQIRDLEDKDKTDQQGINTQGLDQGETDDHGGHDLSPRLGVPCRSLEGTVDRMAHAKAGTEGGHADPEPAGDGDSEKGLKKQTKYLN